MLKPVLGSQIQSGYPLARGLVGCWIMNEGAGNTVADLSGNENDGTIGGNVYSVPGKYGNALNFDGAAASIVTLSKPIPNGPGTVVAWVRATKGANSSVAGAITDNAYALRLYDSMDRFYIHDGVASRQWDYPEGAVSDWCQVAAVSDGTTCWAYINAVSLGAGQANTGLGHIEALGDGYNTEMVGDIDHILYYNRTLSAAEIAQLYREPFCMFERDDIALWTGAMGGEVPTGNAGIMTTWGGYWGATY